MGAWCTENTDRPEAVHSTIADNCGSGADAGWLETQGARLGRALAFLAGGVKAYSGFGSFLSLLHWEIFFCEKL